MGVPPASPTAAAPRLTVHAPLVPFACLVAIAVTFAWIDVDLILGALATPPRDFRTF